MLRTYELKWYSPQIFQDQIEVTHGDLIDRGAGANLVWTTSHKPVRLEGAEVSIPQCISISESNARLCSCTSFLKQINFMPSARMCLNI